MKRILRSLLNIWDKSGFETIQEQDLKDNYLALKESRFEFNLEEDQSIFEYIVGHFYQYATCPGFNLTIDHFVKEEKQFVVDRLDDLKHAKPYVKSDFKRLASELSVKQKEMVCRDILQTAAEILHNGVTTNERGKKVTRYGMKDALQYVITTADPLLAPETGNIRLRGDVRQDRQEVIYDYDKIKADPSSGFGRLCGLTNIDLVCHGIKPGQLWIHAAFTAELKTTFALNWAYNNCTRYGWNSYFLSLEMPYQQIRNMIYCLHSSHKKFLNEGFSPIAYQDLRDGTLDSEEEEYFKNVVCVDFEECPRYGKFYIDRPVDDITMPEIKSRMEIVHQQMPIHLAFIDHAGLVTPAVKNSDYTVALNSVVRDMKKLALNFNQGEGIPVVTLFQINRSGKTAAEKSEGQYRLQDLSYSNEAERSGDVITYTYLDDEKRANAETLFGCLKNRDNEPFENFNAKIIWECKRIYNLDQAKDFKEQAEAIEMDVMKAFE